MDYIKILISIPLYSFILASFLLYVKRRKELNLLKKKKSNLAYSLKRGIGVTECEVVTLPIKIIGKNTFDGIKLIVCRTEIDVINAKCYGNVLKTRRCILEIKKNKVVTVMAVDDEDYIDSFYRDFRKIYIITLFIIGGIALCLIIFMLLKITSVIQ